MLWVEAETEEDDRPASMLDADLILVLHLSPTYLGLNKPGNKPFYPKNVPLSFLGLNGIHGELAPGLKPIGKTVINPLRLVGIIIFVWMRKWRGETWILTSG